jgi:hypothetical protein
MEGEFNMKRLIYILALLVALVGMQSQNARAQDAAPNWNWIYFHEDPRLFATGVAVGAGSTAAYFALRHQKYTTINHGVRHTFTPLSAYAVTTIWCASAFPIVGTLVMQRALTTREVYTGMANCVVPILGGWAVESAFHGQAWYEAK